MYAFNFCFSSEIIHLYGYVHIWKLDRKIPMLCKWYFAISHLVITSFSLYYHMYALFDAVVHAPWGYRKWQEPGGGTFSTCLKLSLFFLFLFFFSFYVVLKWKLSKITRSFGLRKFALYMYIRYFVISEANKQNKKKRK